MSLLKKTLLVLPVLCLLLLRFDGDAFANDFEYPSSSHPYNKTSIFGTQTDRATTAKASYVYMENDTPAEVQYLAVTFSEETYLATNYDYLYIKDSNGDLTRYTGSQLKGKELILPGNSFMLYIDAYKNSGQVCYGYDIVSIRPYDFCDDNGYCVHNEIITRYQGSAQVLEIPLQINGNAITSIGRQAFLGSSVKSVSIPEGITEVSSQAFAECATLSTVTLPESLTYQGLGWGCFQNCSQLTKITVPGSVKIVRPKTFLNCTGLKTAVLKDGVTTVDTTTFSGCTGLTSVSIPGTVGTIGYQFSNKPSLKTVVLGNGMTAIGDSAFFNCAELTSITIPDSVTSIGRSAFSGCSSLPSFMLPSGISAIADNTFYGCVMMHDISIPYGVTGIGSSAFEGCTGLTGIWIPDTVISIGSSAFEGCTGLTNVGIPDTVASVGSRAFYGCTGLTELSVSSSMTTISAETYSGCTGLRIAIIPGNISVIEDGAFCGCTNLVTADLSAGIRSVGNEAFSGCSSLTTLILNDELQRIGSAVLRNTALDEITIPESVSSVAVDAFDDFHGRVYAVIGSAGAKAVSTAGYIFQLKETPGIGLYYDGEDLILQIGDTSLTSLVIPHGVTVIGATAFQGCSRLTAITFPGTVKVIQDSAFRACTRLNTVLLPTSVESVGASAFDSCICLTSADIPTSVESIGTDVFNYCPSLTITVDAGSTAHLYAIQNDIPFVFAYKDAEPFGTPDFVVPARLTTIGEEAFLGVNATCVSLSNKVKTIERMAFADCYQLKRIYIPASVTSISPDAFAGVIRLVIYGAQGSYAETFASEHDLLFVQR